MSSHHTTAQPGRHASGNRAPGSPAPAGHTPERWSAHGGTADVLVLRIPPSSQRARVFEIDVRFVVRAGEASTNPWHAMTVEIDGARQWTRRISTSNPGHTDSLDYHCRCEADVGHPLRVRALTQVGGCSRVDLSIEAEEAAT